MLLPANPQGSKTGQAFHLRASSEEERTAWLNAINLSKQIGANSRSSARYDAAITGSVSLHLHPNAPPRSLAAEPQAAAQANPSPSLSTESTAALQLLQPPPRNLSSNYSPGLSKTLSQPAEDSDNGG
jgi:hypothetical protein